MVQEGLLRESARKGDAFHDVVMLALLRKEWPRAKKLDRPSAPASPRRRRFLDAAPQPPREGIMKKPRSHSGRIRNTSKRFRDGYNYCRRHPDKVIAFFDKHMK